MHEALQSSGTTPDYIHLWNILSNKPIRQIPQFFSISTTVHSISTVLPLFIFFSPPIIPSLTISLNTLSFSPIVSLLVLLSPLFRHHSAAGKKFSFHLPSISFSRVNFTPIEFLIDDGLRLSPFLTPCTPSQICSHSL